MWKKIWENPGLFKGISWGITAVIVFGLLAATLWTSLPTAARVPASTATPAPSASTNPALPTLVDANPLVQAIVRQVTLKTDITSKTNFDVAQYTVQRGDSIFSIAKQYNIKPETVLWANNDLLQNDPSSLRPGQVLFLPAVDGVYYKWEDGDTFQSVADKFRANVDDILNYAGNKFDLTNPVVKAGEYVMIPGGYSESIDWNPPVMAVGKSGTSSSIGQASCPSGPAFTGFVWPSPYHYINGGNDFSNSHLAIDIYAPQGTPISAAGSGVVVFVSTGDAWDHGYGNMIMIDHGNGYVTLYAHLSVVNVQLCQGVGAGQNIGYSGNTGNSFGAHLHFEVREGGGFLNPWTVLPAP
jgi:murein DD-endopeptidase MepM/ murein hydrolase activator NlpD